MSHKELIAIKGLFNTPEGKKVLAIFDRVFYNTISYTRGDRDQTLFNEGHRDVVQFIHNCAVFDSEQQVMPQESKGERQL